MSFADTTDRIEIELDDIPSCPVAKAPPAWLAGLISAIQACSSKAELNALIAPYRARPEADKDLIRPYRDARWDALCREAEIAKTHAEIGQALSTLGQNIAGAVYARPDLVQPLAQAPLNPPVAPLPVPTTQDSSVTARPMTGTFARVKSGPSAGEWGVRVDHAGEVGPKLGDIVSVSRRNGDTQLKRMGTVAWTDGSSSICEIDDNMPVARGTIPTRIRRLINPPAAINPPTTPVNSALAAVDIGLAQELSGVQAESQVNAAVESAGSLAGGQLRGVGFTTAEGYVTALRNGVKQHTADEYRRILRDQHGYTPDQIAALNVEIIPEIAHNPNAQLITHTPTGPSVFDLPLEQRAFKVGAQKALKKDAPRLNTGDLIAGAVAEGRGVLISWAGSGKIKRAELLVALAEINRSDAAPPAKSARAQAGRAALALNSRGFVCRAANRPLKGETPWPAGVSARWIAGTLARGATADASLGQRSLVVDLHDNGALSFEGSAYLADQVRADYEARCADDIYTSADLTAWLDRTLRYTHHGVAYGVTVYVPAGEAESAKELVKAVSKLWGTQWMRGLPVATEDELIRGLTVGLAGEIESVCEALALARAAAVEDGKMVGPRRAQTLLRQTEDIRERVKGYALMLGDSAVAGLMAQLVALDEALRPLCDDTSARSAMLEME